MIRLKAIMGFRDLNCFDKIAKQKCSRRDFVWDKREIWRVYATFIVESSIQVNSFEIKQSVCLIIGDFF